MNRPVASVIIPVYNSERYLPECLDSVLQQTLEDFELLIIDDGSTDSSLEIARRYEQNDKRIRVIQQDHNQGNALARERGMELAQGTWLYFLDSDDVINPKLLELSTDAGDSSQADIVIFRTQTLHAVTGERYSCPWAFDSKHFPTPLFSPSEHPDYLLTSFQNWVWNKLFRRSFILESNIHFLDFRRTEDLYFTVCALTQAHSIYLLDEELHQYRISNPYSTFQTSDTYPLEFYRAFLATKHALEQNGSYPLYQKSFANHALNGFITNLGIAKTEEAFFAIVHQYAENDGRGAELLDIARLRREDAYRESNFDLAAVLIDSDVSDISKLFAFYQFTAKSLENSKEYCSRLRLETAKAKNNQARLASKLNAVTNSKSFRIGLALTSAPRAIRKRMQKQ